MLYLGLISLVLFFALSFGTGSSVRSNTLGLNTFFNTNSTIPTKNPLSDLFADPSKNLFSESPDLTFIQQNALFARTPSFLVSGQVLGSLGIDTEVESRKEIIEYTVQSGDTFKSLAEKFNISLDTLLWSNDLTKNSKVKNGQSLIILPVSGVLHYVKEGDTLNSIAKKYKAEVDEISSFNELSADEKIDSGDILVVPGGTMPSLPKQKIADFPQIPLADSYFILPTGGKITQGLHWYNAVDIASSCGTPVYAAAQGEVLKAKSGWNGGAGNYISILHPNGVITFYDHLLKQLVSAGDKVSQGQMIALVGGEPGASGAGKSTGCHVHFEVRGAQNPFAK